MDSKLISDWLTGVRIDRMGHALITIGSLSTDMSGKEAERILWRTVGGPLNEIETMIDVLQTLKLIRMERDIPQRTQAGHRLARSLRENKQQEFSLTLIRSGCFHEQARLLLEYSTIGKDGDLRCALRIAQTLAPQLLALLQSWNDVQLRPTVLVPPTLVQELNTIWALLPPEPEVPKWAAERRATGDRAEMYTVQLERSRVRADLVAWVARDSDSFGYDVEDRSIQPCRCIEVKGSRDTAIVFYLSEREWCRAQEIGDRYEVHFWGGIDLNVEPAVEYAALRAAGYPVVIPHFAAAMSNEWSATPVKWRITKIIGPSL